jgi:hypothetical protein
MLIANDNGHLLVLIETRSLRLQKCRRGDRVYFVGKYT